MFGASAASRSDTLASLAARRSSDTAWHCARAGGHRAAGLHPPGLNGKLRNGYYGLANNQTLCADLHRFAFLLGASNGEELFGEPTP